MLSIKTIVVGELETNCYFVTDDETGKTLLIDPGAEPEKLLSAIKENRLQVTGIINTHGHGDHIGANAGIVKHFSKDDISIFIHSKDASMLTDPKKNLSAMAGSENVLSPAGNILLNDGDIISLNDKITLEVMHTPGHTEGSICLVCGKEYLFSGDTLFKDSVGRCDLPGGDESKLVYSLDRLKKLPRNMVVLPGHGPQTTIEKEIRHNPFLTGKAF